MTWQNDRITSIPAPEPVDYDRQYNFLDWETQHPALPKPAAGLEAEFNAIQQALDETQGRARLIQRSDGALANQSVGVDQLKPDVQIGVNPPNAWSAFTTYVVRDSVVFDNQAWYVCLESHTSTADFATDLAAGKWQLIFDFNDLLTTEVELLVAQAEAAATAAEAAASSLNLPELASGDEGKLLQVNPTYDGYVLLTGVGTSQIADGAVTTAKLAAGAATAAATPNTLVLRDANGRFQAASPLAADDVATMGYADSNLTILRCAQAIAQVSPTRPGDGTEVRWRAVTTGFSDVIHAAAMNPNGLVVLACAGGKIYTTTDWITFTSRTTGTAEDLRGAAYDGSGLFCVVGGAGTILTSPDGVTWTSRTSGVATGLRAVTHSRQRAAGLAVPPTALFCAVGASGVILTSPDGVTWTPRTSGTAENLLDVAVCPVLLGDVVYCAVGTNGVILTSAGGTTWVSRSSGTTANLSSVACRDANATVFIAAGGDSSKMVRISEDAGASWSGISSSGLSAITNDFDKVAYWPPVDGWLYSARDGLAGSLGGEDSTVVYVGKTADLAADSSCLFFDGEDWFMAKFSGVLYRSHRKAPSASDVTKATTALGV